MDVCRARLQLGRQPPATDADAFLLVFIAVSLECAPCTQVPSFCLRTSSASFFSPVSPFGFFWKESSTKSAFWSRCFLENTLRTEELRLDSGKEIQPQSASEVMSSGCPHITLLCFSHHASACFLLVECSLAVYRIPFLQRAVTRWQLAERKAARVM